jgi:hypothetical protein
VRTAWSPRTMVVPKSKMRKFVNLYAPDDTNWQLAGSIFRASYEGSRNNLKMLSLVAYALVPEMEHVPLL